MAYALVHDSLVVQVVAMARDKFQVSLSLQWVKTPPRSLVVPGYTWTEGGGFQPPAEG